MISTLARRIFLAHLELNYRLGRKVTQAEFGRMIAKAMGRAAPFTAAAVSRWEAGSQLPSPRIVEAIAVVTHTDPGWISHGARSRAPAPPARAERAATSRRRPAAEPEKVRVRRRRS